MALITKCIVNATHRSAIFVIHFIVRDVAALMAKLGTRKRASVYKGEWVYCTRSEAFKDKAWLQVHRLCVIKLNMFS